MVGELSWLATADGASPWSQATVLVTGLGVSGFAAADGLLEFGARVIVVEDTVTEVTADKAELLRTLGADVRLGPGSSALRPDGIDLVVTTGWSPRHPLLAAAAAAGIGIWSEPELAWRLARPQRPVPWLGITGTNGKTTTTQMLESMLRAAGLRTAAVGNIGRPVMETVLDPEPYDVLAVELSSHQLHWSHSLSLHSAVVLNLQPDHFEWHGGAAGYRDAKASIYERVQIACVYNVADPATERMVEDQICALDDLEPNQAVNIDGVPIAVVRDSSGAVFAIGDTCTHGYISLSEGFVEGETIECWAHGSLFSLKVGQGAHPPPAYDPVPVYKVEIVDGLVFIDPTVILAV